MAKCIYCKKRIWFWQAYVEFRGGVPHSESDFAHKLCWLEKTFTKNNKEFLDNMAKEIERECSLRK